MQRHARKAEKSLPKPPDEAALREAALAHLARFAATEAGLARVLSRRIDRWARAAGEAGVAPEIIDSALRAAREAVPRVVQAMRGAGAVDDAAFAESRARRLIRQGKSRRAALAHLAAKGVDTSLATRLLPADPASDLAAACAYLRRRRLPPFGLGDRDRALASLARGGFSRDVAERALDLEQAQAEALVEALRRG
jgi:regulatory protein